MNYVISANYRDRSSPNKWLVRLANEHPSKAVERSTVHAKGVTFGVSSDYEDGFGCSAVAYAEELMDEAVVPEGTINLRFDTFHNEFVDEFEKSYENLIEIHLNAHGKIKGLLASSSVYVDVPTTEMQLEEVLS